MVYDDVVRSAEDGALTRPLEGSNAVILDVEDLAEFVTQCCKYLEVMAELPRFGSVMIAKTKNVLLGIP